ncbi:MAG TPA: hypothetical protein ENJ42_01690 [Hellea balneolensis]|uniref:Uncharacterized protein n=1 Tax=Hellea balneolensis TaxID=287478 RepID=A0A7C5QZS8_9PROT|nr:hypothetical protein [Hellea balneolensis]
MNMTLKILGVMAAGAIVGLAAAQATADELAPSRVAAVTVPAAPSPMTAKLDAKGVIGIARIDKGRLIPAPMGELEDWGFLDRRSPVKFQPISAAEHLKTLPEIDFDGKDTTNQIDEIRLTAYDLGMKYVLIYGRDADARAGSFGGKAMMETGLKVRENTPAPGADAKALLVDTLSGEIYGTLISNEVEFGVGDLTDKVEDLVNELTDQKRISRA